MKQPHVQLQVVTFSFRASFDKCALHSALAWTLVSIAIHVAFHNAQSQLDGNDLKFQREHRVQTPCGTLPASTPAVSNVRHSSYERRTFGCQNCHWQQKGVCALKLDVEVHARTFRDHGDLHHFGGVSLHDYTDDWLGWFARIVLSLVRSTPLGRLFDGIAYSRNGVHGYSYSTLVTAVTTWLPAKPSA